MPIYAATSTLRRVQNDLRFTSGISLLWLTTQWGALQCAGGFEADHAVLFTTGPNSVVYRKSQPAIVGFKPWEREDNPGMGSLYRCGHEFVFVFKNGRSAHRNNVQLGGFGRNRSNVWCYPGANCFARGGAEGHLLALHPTVKPVAL